MMSDLEMLMRKRKIEESALLGNKLEFAFRGMFEGTRPMVVHNSTILDVVDRLVQIGKLTYETAFQIREFLRTNINEKSIVSRQSSHISLISKDDKLDDFELEDLMKWLSYELINDPFFSEYLSGHNNYLGMREFLNNSEFVQVSMVEDLHDGIDFVNCGEKYFYTMEYDDEMALFSGEVSQFMRISSDEDKLLSTGLLDGKIYWSIGANKLYVNLSDEKFYEVDVKNGKGKNVFGRVLGTSKDNMILIKKENRLLIQKASRRKNNISYIDVCTGYVDTKTDFFSVRSYDTTTEMYCVKNTYDLKKCIYDREFDERIVWENIIDNCFVLAFNLEENLSDRLLLFKLYQPPFPMTLKNVLQKMEVIERMVEKGKIKHGSKYSELVYLMSELGYRYKDGDDILYELVQSKISEEIDSYYYDEFTLWTEPHRRIFLSKIDISNQNHEELLSNDDEVDNMFFSRFFRNRDEKPDN